MIVDKDDNISLCDHLVICAWDQKIVEILEYIGERKKQCGAGFQILILTDKGNTIPWDQIPGDGVYRIVGDLTDEKTLRNAEVERSHNVILLADEREKELADAKSILIVLALKSISKRVHICVEAVEPDGINSLKLARADHIISIPNLREKLLAQASVTHYVSHVYRELFNKESDQNIFSIPVGIEYVGKTFGEAARHLYTNGIILLALWDHQAGKVQINPSRGRKLHEYDAMMIIASQKTFDFSKVCEWI